MDKLAKLLAQLVPSLKWLEANLENLFPRPVYEKDPANLPMNQEPPQNSGKQPVETPSTMNTTKATLNNFCLAIRDHEGSPGDLNYKNNNPGNFRCSSVGYAPKYGNVLCVDTKSGKFAKFPTYELGWLYLQNIVKERIQKYPEWTFIDFFSNYAPSVDDNNPVLYAKFVAFRCGVGTDFRIKNILV